MSKQDRQGVRTPANLEQKYRWSDAFKKQKKEMEALDDKTNQQNVDLFQQVSKNTDELRTLRSDVTGLKKDCSSFENSLSALKRGFDSMTLFLQTLFELFAKQESKLDGVFDDLTTANQNIYDLQRQIDEALVEITADASDSTLLTADKSFAEIETAIQLGLCVRAKLLKGNYYCYLQVASHQTGTEVNFIGNYNGTSLTLKISSDETVESS